MRPSQMDEASRASPHPPIRANWVPPQAAKPKDGARNPYEVVLYVYDLSNGIAKTMGPLMLGKVIEAIYHTGVVIYGHEYFFGGGIATSPPGESNAGIPMRKVALGITDRSQEEFHHYLRQQSHRFTERTYDLFYHNCNNFTFECVQFLLPNGAKVYPFEIINLPNVVLSSELGRAFLPLMRQIRPSQNSNANASFIPAAGGRLMLPPVKFNAPPPLTNSALAFLRRQAIGRVFPTPVKQPRKPPFHTSDAPPPNLRALFLRAIPSFTPRDDRFETLVALAKTSFANAIHAKFIKTDYGTTITTRLVKALDRFVFRDAVITVDWTPDADVDVDDKKDTADGDADDKNDTDNGGDKNDTDGGDDDHETADGDDEDTPAAAPPVPVPVPTTPPTPTGPTTRVIDFTQLATTTDDGADTDGSTPAADMVALHVKQTLIDLCLVIQGQNDHATGIGAIGLFNAILQSLYLQMATHNPSNPALPPNPHYDAAFAVYVHLRDATVSHVFHSHYNDVLLRFGKALITNVWVPTTASPRLLNIVREHIKTSLRLAALLPLTSYITTTLLDGLCEAVLPCVSTVQDHHRPPHESPSADRFPFIMEVICLAAAGVKASPLPPPEDLRTSTTVLLPDAYHFAMDTPVGEEFSMTICTLVPHFQALVTFLPGANHIGLSGFRLMLIALGVIMTGSYDYCFMVAGFDVEPRTTARNIYSALLRNNLLAYDSSLITDFGHLLADFDFLVRSADE